MQKLKSRKLWVAVLSAAVIALADQLGLDHTQTKEILGAAVSYILAQGAHDVVHGEKR